MPDGHEYFAKYLKNPESNRYYSLAYVENVNRHSFFHIRSIRFYSNIINVARIG